VKHPPTFIALPYRLCTVCKQYRRVTAGCQHATWIGNQGVSRPFICAPCNQARRAA
jgi:hypothetical protein